MQSQDPAKKRNRLLTVSVLSARGLTAMDNGGTSDPYVALSVGCGGKHSDRRAQSKVVSKTLNPDFNEELKVGRALVAVHVCMLGARKLEYSAIALKNALCNKTNIRTVPINAIFRVFNQHFLLYFRAHTFV